VLFRNNASKIPLPSALNSCIKYLDKFKLISIIRYKLFSVGQFQVFCMFVIFRNSQLHVISGRENPDTLYNVLGKTPGEGCLKLYDWVQTYG
jgi:hypothetical protein